MAAESEPAVDIGLVSIRKTYGDVVAVDGIDLEVLRGEFFTMLGPSGSGKTTTLRLIAGFERPGLGPDHARRRGRGGPAAVRARREHRLPGLRALPAHDRRRERRLRAQGEGRRPGRSAGTRVAQALETVRLEGYDGRKPVQLSGGQRQRVALARAIVNHPRVLLLDEPLGALDLKLRQEMQIELKRIQQEVGITFVYVTHDQEEALTMSDRIAVFSARPDRADRHAGRGLRAPGERVRGRVRRRLEPARARRPTLHGAAGEDPRSSARASARARGRDRAGRGRPPSSTSAP